MHSLRVALAVVLVVFSLDMTAQSRPPFEVRMPSRTFTPEARVPGDLATRIRNLKQAQSLERVHVIVQFPTPLEPEDRARIERQGLRLLAPVNRRTWYASVAGTGTTAFQGARWADLIRAPDKISTLVSATPQPYQMREGGRVA